MAEGHVVQETRRGVDRVKRYKQLAPGLTLTLGGEIIAAADLRLLGIRQTAARICQAQRGGIVMEECSVHARRGCLQSACNPIQSINVVDTSTWRG